MILLGDAASSLQWAVDNAGSAVWLLALLAGAVGWAAKRQRKVLARMGTAARPVMPPPGAVAAGPRGAAAAQSAPAAPPRPPPRVFTPRNAVSSLDVPVAVQSVSSRVLREAFGDPAHARAAVILAEVLAPPVALR